MSGNPTYANLRKRKKAKRAKFAERGRLHSNKMNSVKASAAPVGAHDKASDQSEGNREKGGQDMKTSAVGRARKKNAPAQPWDKPEYCGKAYLWRYIRAVFALLKRSMDGSIKAVAEKLVVWWKGGWPLDLFELATSYPFLKRAVDLTSERGNAPGPDGKTFYENFQGSDAYEPKIKKMKAQLRSGEYRPGGLRRIVVDDGNRTLDLPNVIDRVVARAVSFILAAIWEARFHKWSFGFRQGISIHHALTTLMQLCEERDRWVLRGLDLSKAFWRVPHNTLLDIVHAGMGSQRLTDLTGLFVKRPEWKGVNDRSGIGLPMGDPLSPVLFNIYVDRVLDQVLAARHPEIVWIRWADDIILICESVEQAEEHVRTIQSLLMPAGLLLNEKKTFTPAATAILKAGQHIEYLGYDVSYGDNGKFKLHVPNGTYDRLGSQIIRDIMARRGQRYIDVEAKGKAITHDIEQRMAGWLEAYAPAITDGEIHTLKGKMSTLFEAVRKELADLPDVVELGLTLVKWPSGRTVKELWKRGRAHWEARKDTPVPDAYSRLLFGRRIATVTQRCPPQPTGDCLTGGADLVPAPTAVVMPYEDRKPGCKVEDRRAELIDPPDHGDAAGTDGPIEEVDPKSRRVVVITDGGSRGNPGPAAAAYVAYDAAGKELFQDSWALDGEATNMVAEYNSVIGALNAVFEKGVRDVLMRNDNRTVVDQLTSPRRPRHPRMRQLCEQAMEAIEAIHDIGARVVFEHVLRDKTQAADALVNVALDQVEQDAA